MDTLRTELDAALYADERAEREDLTMIVYKEIKVVDGKHQYKWYVRPKGEAKPSESDGVVVVEIYRARPKSDY